MRLVNATLQITTSLMLISVHHVSKDVTVVPFQISEISVLPDGGKMNPERV